ncbi:MAG: DUF1638 domain-containing protein [Rubellimicrobium sp.]|nr:DUF1638 domain-containing protein [Rubellimicrobium sp.]
MSTPSDRILTEDGLAPKGEGRLLVIACGALAREIVAIRDANHMTHMDLQCLPAILHNSPQRIPALVEAAVLDARDRYESIFVAYADCGTGGLLRKTCDRLGVPMLDGPHCYSFFEGNRVFAAHDGEGANFWLTDFLARQFEAFVIRPLGLDRHPELRDMYFGNYEKLIYLAQVDDPALTEAARKAADFLGLEFERRFTGYGDLAVAMAGLK